MASSKFSRLVEPSPARAGTPEAADALPRASLAPLRRLIGAGIAWALSCCAPGPDAGRPNIVLFLTDDVGYGDLGCYGHPFSRTPNLDRFADGALRLTNCYAASPNCSPSRGALLTGRIPARLGLYDVLSGREPNVPEDPNLRGNMRLLEEELTVAEILGEAGYDTIQLGKWHLDRSSAAPEARGLDPEAAPAEHHRSAEAHGFVLADSRRRPATELVERLIAWIDGRAVQERPFFAYLSTYEVHEPLAELVAPEWSAPFRSASTAAEARQLVASGPPRTELQDSGAPLYFGALAQIDAAFGTLIAYLEDSGRLENTLVIFTSDNGPEYRLPHSYGSTGGLRGTKGRVYEGGLRVPAIVSWPARLPAGRVCDAPVLGLDVLPTLCAAAGVSDPRAAERDGVDVLPMLRGEPLPERALYWGAWAAPGRAQYALRRGRYKLLAATPPLTAAQRVVEHVKSSPLVRFELYDLETDPGEQIDLAEQAAKRVEVMSQELISLKRAATSEGPEWDLEEVRYKARGAWPRAPYGRWSGPQ